MIILVTLVFAVLSAFCYRIGGMNKESAKHYFPWFPQVLVRSWFRDLNCSILNVLWCWIFLPKVAWFWYLCALGMQYGMTTTYWDESKGFKDKICKVINWMYPDDNFYLHGMFIALSTLFIAIPAGVWVWAVVRIIVLGALMGVWCYYISSYIAKITGWGTDFIDEYGRGAFIQLTKLLLKIGV